MIIAGDKPNFRLITVEEVLRGVKTGEYKPESFFTTWPDARDPAYWGHRILLLKANVVYPDPVNVVSEWKLVELRVRDTATEPA